MERDKTKLEDWEDIRTLVSMSIGTDKGRWWADGSFGSELWILRQNGKVDATTAGDVQRLVLECLDWLKTDELAKSVTVEAERVGKTTIAYSVTVLKPDGDTIMVKDVWNAIVQ